MQKPKQVQEKKHDTLVVDRKFVGNGSAEALIQRLVKAHLAT